MEFTREFLKAFGHGLLCYFIVIATIFFILSVAEWKY